MHYYSQDSESLQCFYNLKMFEFAIEYRSQVVVSLSLTSSAFPHRRPPTFAPPASKPLARRTSKVAGRNCQPIDVDWLLHSKHFFEITISPTAIAGSVKRQWLVGLGRFSHALPILAFIFPTKNRMCCMGVGVPVIALIDTSLFPRVFHEFTGSHSGFLK